ncbi:TolC family protein [Novipirellula artificiosorum]|uniref:Cobalt-zinc-cadmium resistance protein CzcC n=1 Tax=Novipirellula artificiosorum TaxID=2528016 RepID=A0A5C6DRL7_9BACT|nr:TolC family protein [Novipirellula artificiosorum]TWU39408.1 Cobalt-zinc-cadmium resistance protein CzcC precursor [Novipirellula artificiosorum]
MIPIRRKHFARLLLLATTVGVTGCSTTRHFSALYDYNPTNGVDSLAQTPPAPSSPAIQQVVFDEMSLVDSKLEDMTGGEVKDAAVRFAAPTESDFGGIPSSEYQSGVAAMTLADFEALALGNNPTIQELVATTQKAAGFRTQVGLRANPSIGYQANQLADQGTDQHTVFISQTIITGDKLALNRCVLNEALRAQLLQLEAQKYRVTTDIHVKFFDALAAQERIEQIRDFLSVVDKGLELAELRKKALEGSQLDVLQAKVQKNEIELALQQAEVSYAAAWRELGALAGSPQMTPVRLLGELPESATTLDWSTLASTIIASSPEYQAAQTRVSQARANLERQCVQPIPNLDVQLAAGVDNATNSGLINLQIGAPIPVFNKNQGNIAAARAELLRSAQEVQRIENSIKARLGAVSRDYDSSLAAVEKYAKDILPNAAESLQLAETAYKTGETNFVQVLVARRTYFDTNLQYISSQSLLGQARARVDGYVLTGALDAVIDNSGDDSLRGLTFSQQ